MLALVGFTLVLLGLVGLVKVGLDRRAARAAAVASATDEARVIIARQVRAFGAPAFAGAEAAGELRMTLQEHLTVSARSDEQLADDCRRLQGALAYASRDLRELAAAPVPDLPADADRDALSDALTQLEQVDQRGAQLSQTYLAAAHASERWAAALLTMREHHQRYVDTVSAQPESHDPQELLALWEAERVVLDGYRDAVEAAAQVPGLELLAAAYLAYVDANLAWVDEAVDLLAAGDVDTYNARLTQLFAVPDPFGFRAAVADATTRSLDTGVLEDLAATAEDGAEFVALTRAQTPDGQPSAPSPPAVQGRL